MRFRLSVIVLAASIVAASAENLPPAVKSAVAENSKSCKKTTVQPGFLTRQDINAGGRPDLFSTMAPCAATAINEPSAVPSDASLRFSRRSRMAPTRKSSTRSFEEG